MSLADIAAKKARPDADQRPDTPTTSEAHSPATDPELLPDIELDENEGGPELVDAHVAWSRVMAEIRKIAKSDLYNQSGTRYNFRSVDRTVNAFAPALRKHGVLVLPVGVKPEYRETKSKSGTTMHECTVVVTWMIVGPKGDTLPSTLQSAGEALDSSDKSTAKAQSVALRVLLLTGGMVPSGDPDPDAQHIDRGEAPIRPATSYVDEVAHPRTSVRRLLQIKYELEQSGQMGALVTNEVGDQEAIGSMVIRIGKERQAKGEPS